MYQLWKRQGGDTFSSSGNQGDYGYDDGDDDYDGYYGESWWWTPAGMATRYSIVALLFAAILFFFVGGYYHARRRLAKGLQPLPYHRWMVARYMQQPPMNHRQPYHSAHHGYQMDSYPPPPPAYNVAEVPPPVYQPPQGGSKVMADQGFVRVQPLPPTPDETAGSSERIPAWQ